MGVLSNSRSEPSISSTISSRDEPFIIPLSKGEIGVVPYTAHLNDLHNLLPVYDLAQFELLLKEEFDQLYEEGAKRRTDDGCESA